MAALLGQDKVWYSRRSQTLIEEDLDEMDLDHIKNLRNYLLRNAEAILWSLVSDLERSGMVHGSEQAQFDLDRELARLDGADPEAWMRGTILFESLTDRLVTVAASHFTRTNLAAMHRLVKLALSSPPGTHTVNQLRDIEALRRKLDGTGKDVR